LPKELVEKIAAGEVVERPASVVKELLENALDAKATHITIILENAGTTLICVSDNGSGMDAADLSLAVEAHATSKISSTDDLFAIHTLGFRGEALASVCAVARVDITTRQANAVAGNTIHVEGGVADPIKQTGAPVGTSVSVSDLFFNVPARRKFLRSANTELQAITTLISNYCMAHPHVHLSLSNDGKQIINSPSTKQMIDKIGHIYGSTITKQLLPVSHSADSHDSNQISLVGYISNPSLTRADKKQFTFFLNGRFIKNPNLLSAVIEGYETLLMVGRNPIGVINIIADPKSVDVNVHPSKDIVKFDHENRFLDVIKTAVKQALGETHLLREHKEKDEKDGASAQYAQQTFASTSSSAPTETSRNAQPQTNTNAQQKQSHSAQTTQSQQQPQPIARETVASYQQTVVAAMPSATSISTASSVQPSISVVDERQGVLSSTPNVIVVDEHLTLRYLGLLHRTYAVCESKDGLVMIDFHAAHERYLYEQIKLHRMDSARRTQALLSPLKIELTPAQLLLANEHQSLLESLGFFVDEFGGSTILVRSVPLLFHKQMTKQVLLDVIDELSESSSGSSRKIDETLDKIMIRMSCRAADKAGDELSDEKIKDIIRQVSTAGHKYSCPHGRPIFLSVNKAELEKMFKRRV